MLIMSVSVGVIAGLFISHVRLHLGLPGHKVLFWMTPVLVARLLGRCRAGTTAGALAAAFTACSLGGHLGGGIIGLPLVGVAGVFLDTVIGWIEKRKINYGILMITLVGLSAMTANLIVFGKRMINSVGGNLTFLFGVTGIWYDLICYACFGLAAGLLAASTVSVIGAKRKKKTKRGETDELSGSET